MKVLESVFTIINRASVVITLLVCLELIDAIVFHKRKFSDVKLRKVLYASIPLIFISASILRFIFSIT